LAQTEQKPCFSFQKKGTCSKGANCIFSHSFPARETRDAASPPAAPAPQRVVIVDQESAVQPYRILLKGLEYGVDEFTIINELCKAGSCDTSRILSIEKINQSMACALVQDQPTAEKMIHELHMNRNQLHPLVTKMRNGYLSVQKCEQRGYDKLKSRIEVEQASAQPPVQFSSNSAAPPKTKRARTEPDAEPQAPAVTMKPITAGASNAAAATARFPPAARRKESVDVEQVRIKSLAEIKAENAKKAAAEAAAKAKASSKSD
jgi:hypothetical protein